MSSIRGLPEVYQVYIPADRSTCLYKEFDKLVKIAAPKCSPGGGADNSWHRIKNGNYIPSSTKYPDIPEISYEDWKAALTIEQSSVYAVGDWVTYRGPGESNKNWYTGVTRQLTKVGNEGYQKNVVWANDESSGVYMKDIRPATPAEIAASTQVSTEDYRIEKIKGKRIAVHCNTAEECAQVVEICNTMGKGTMSSKDAGWRCYGNKVCVGIPCYPGYGDVNHYTKTETGYTLIPASTFIAHNRKEKMYKVGDWVWPLAKSGEGKKGYGHSRALGRAYKIWEIQSDWVRMETADGKQDLGNGGIHRDDVRLATQEEIDQATEQSSKSVSQVPVTSEWKIGDRFQCNGVGIVYEIAQKGGEYIIKWKSGDRDKETSYEKATIDDNWGNVWKPYQEASTEKKTMDDWKGTRVRILANGGNYNMGYEYTYGTVIEKSGTCLLVKLDKDGAELNFYGPENTRPECEIVTNESKQVNNQQSNQKPKQNKPSYEQEQQHISKSKQYTGTAVLLTDPQAVKRGQARTGTPLCDRRQPGYTERGHQGHRKAVSSL